MTLNQFNYLGFCGLLSLSLSLDAWILVELINLVSETFSLIFQKYGLHTRRSSPSPQSTGNPTPQLVVLGSIWVPPEYAAAAAAAQNGGGPTIYSSHPGSLTSTHYCAPSVVPQEFYSTPPPLPPPQSHQLHHHNLLHHHPSHHIYKISSSSKQPLSSPDESDVRSGERVVGDRSESIEDGKSESNSWKGDSGDHHHHHNGGRERRGLASLRDEDNKSNGSDQITLKF